MQVKKVIKDKISLYTESFGYQKNKTCILISGATAPARFWTDNFCNYLVDNNFFVIRYDHRNIGLSSKVDWKTNSYTLANLAEDAIAILDDYDIENANAIGHSMGGYICQELAIKYPERINKIVPISAGPIAQTKETQKPLTKEESALQNKTWEVLLSREDSINLEDTIKGYLIIWRYLNGSVELDETLAREYTLDLLTRTNHEIKPGNNHELVMRNLLESLNQRKNVLETIKTPTLVIHGSKDPLALTRFGKSIAETIPNAKLEIVANMVHMIFNKELEKHIAKIILNFL